MKFLLLLLLVISLFFSGCPFIYPPYDRYIYIQPVVRNLEMLNTEYDEINAAPPPGYYGSKALVYASNAASRGEHFNIMYSGITIEMFWLYGEREDYTSNHSFSLTTSAPVPFLEKLHSTDDEYGPYLYSLKNRDIYLRDMDSLASDILYMFASNRPHDGGDSFNIYYYLEEEGLQFFGGNSTLHDYYPTYHRESNTLYFCSNRDGNYAIYRYSDEDTESLEDLLKHVGEAEPVWELEPWDTKFPYIFKDIMVFSSNRDGPYNLYFSQFEDGEWSSPKRLPERIELKNDNPFSYLNSSYNEYRPVLFQGWSDRTDDNKLLIFSSDRPGGKGGFDLYLAVLPLNIFDG